MVSTIPSELHGGGDTLVVEDANNHALRFMVPPGSAFSQWNAGPGDSDLGVTPTIDGLVATPSGAAWVKLDVESSLIGFERVARPGNVVTPRSNPCDEDEDAAEADLLGVASDERLWVACSGRIVTIGVDGVTAIAHCAPCARGFGAFAAAANGAVWFVNDADEGGWDLRLLDAAGSVVGARHFGGSMPFELVDNGVRLVWLRGRAGQYPDTHPAIVEGLATGAWQTAASVAYTRGLSERVGRAVSPAWPDLQSLANTSDGSTWFMASGFARVIRVDVAGHVTEYLSSTEDTLPLDLASIGDRIWVRMQNSRVYRVAPGGTARPSLPVLNQRLRILKRLHVDRRPGQPIAFLGALSIASGRAIPGTRVSIRCLKACHGRTVSGVITKTTLRMNTGIRLYNHAKLETIATLSHYRATRQVFELTRGEGRSVKKTIVAIDGVPVNACGC